MIRRLLQALDPQRLSTMVGDGSTSGYPTLRRVTGGRSRWTAGPCAAPATPTPRLKHVLVAVEYATGVVLAQTEVDTKTNEITRFVPVLGQISDLRGL
jgi:hypothetical protein